MPFAEHQGLRYYTFDNLSRAGVIHGVFTRRGGASPRPWASLNMGATVGDDWGRVQYNIRRALAALRLPAGSRFDVWLVHGRDAVVAPRPRPIDNPEPPPKADIVLTNNPAVTLVMRFADCVPILLYDPRQQALGLAHAGWKGTVLGTAAAAVEAMQQAFGSRPADLLAAIGPSIGPDHYEVGDEVVAQAREAFAAQADAFLPRHRDRTHFDLWAANRWWLTQAGMPAAQIETAGICTACHVDDWYSHRAEDGRTGRFGALLALPHARRIANER